MLIGPWQPVLSMGIASAAPHSPVYGGRQVTVAGIVTASFQGPNAVGIGGFFIQTPDANVDANPATSEGAFDLLPHAILL